MAFTSRLQRAPALLSGHHSLTGRHDQNAWKQLEDMPAEQAQQRYVELVTSLSPGWQEQGKQKTSTGGPGGPVFSSLVNSEEEADTGPPLGSLHLLASEGDTSAVAFLLDNGADIDSRDAEGCTALHWAADRGSLEVTQLLLQRGAAVNAQDSDGQTPLHYAALNDQREVCSTLLSAGADASIRDHAGKRPQDVDEGPSSWDIWPDTTV
ncbi:Acyl-CoA-binding domain-containing protein 6 [Coccomyxa sp. Obi]|nr:Acyl-CoA-binding domain-containing protein 6 [Coccomyxa sp. Obi]